MRLFLLMALLFFVRPVHAQTTIVAENVFIGSAQADAEQMARTGTLRHCGRNGGRREGIGMGATPDAALRSCCYWGRYRVVDKGVAWSPIRRAWFAVVRYE